MPLSQERIAYIRGLANDEVVDALDTSAWSDADWAAFDQKHDAETQAFCKDPARSSEELHVFAEAWNWDKGVDALQLILDNPACEAATALMIYWRAAPEYYLRYGDRDAAQDHERATLDFISSIEERYMKGAFKSGAMRFNPRDPNEMWVGAYDDMRAQWVRALPDEMYKPVGSG